MSDTLTPPNARADALPTTLARWRAIVDAELKGAPFEKKLVTRTFEGIALQPLYTRADLSGLTYLDTAPGAAPFLRGSRSGGYKAAPWAVAQEIAADSVTEFNAALRDDLMLGQTAVVVVPDIASRRGLDPDEAPAADVAAEGLSIACGDDFAAALKGVDLSAIAVHVDAGPDAATIPALYAEYVRSRNVAPASLTGSVAADPLGWWPRRGTLPAPLPVLYDSLAGWTAWAKDFAPQLRTIGIHAALCGNAGGSATQELAFALATAAEYLRALGLRGLSVADVAKRMAFEFAIGPQFFTELAKFRAFRPLLTRVIVGFGGAPELAATATVHATTGRWNKTLLDAHVNMLRVTTEALSAVLGGCDSLHVAPFDAVTGKTTEFSRRVARNIHTMLAEEFSFAETADPAGGSWYIEKLTDTLAREAWRVFQEIEAHGGCAAALRSGYIQQQVAKAAADKKDAVAKRRYGLVGTNLFPNLKETPLVAATPAGASLQSVRSAEIRQRRHSVVLADIVPQPSARFTTALAAARNGATVGQLARIGDPDRPTEQTIVAWERRRASEDFESLRTATAEFAKKTGSRPKVFLAKMGPVLQHKARADFAAGFFGVAGFESVAKQTFDIADAAAQAAVKSGAKVAVLCSTDDTYPALVPAFAQAVKARSSSITVVLAGLPADPAVAAQFRAAGVDEFIHIRASVYDVLAKLLQQIGVLA